MQEQVVHSTFVIERSFAKLPQKVFAAFSDIEKKRLWFESPTHQIEEFRMDFRVGGTESHRYRFEEGTPFPGVELLNQGVYLDIDMNLRIVTPPPWH